MIRTLVIGALAGAALTAGVTTAIGASENSGTTVQEYEQRYTLVKRKKSTGTAIAISSRDQQNPQPKRIKNFDLTFPAGTEIDSKAAAQCKATDTDFASEDHPNDACPRGSRLGGGRAAVRSRFPGQGDFLGTVYAYNANKGMIFFVDFSTADTSWVLRPKWRGVRLVTTVPRTCIPPAIPQNDCQTSFGKQEMVLVQLSVDIGAKSRGRGDNRRILLRTPKTCPSGGWTFKSDFRYADGTSLNIPEKSRCSRD